MNEDTGARPAPEQEVFLRVWERVMDGRPPQSSPIEVSGREPAPPRRPAPPAEQPENDLPRAGYEPVCGELSAGLRRQTMEALELWQLFRHLARRTRGAAARTLTDLAAGQHRLARRLSAAYFLHSGIRYWPSEQLSAPVISSYRGALRQAHQAGQQAEGEYRLAMEEADDPALKELYAELAEAARGQCRRLRGLLEQGMP